jgi:hypothetical protein
MNILEVKIEDLIIEGYSYCVKTGKNVLKSILLDKNGYLSRKLAAAWLLTLLISFMSTAHIFAFHFTGNEVERIIEGEDYLRFLEFIWATYYGANVIKGIGMSRRQTENQETQD